MRRKRASHTKQVGNDQRRRRSAAAVGSFNDKSNSREKVLHFKPLLKSTSPSIVAAAAFFPTRERKVEESVIYGEWRTERSETRRRKNKKELYACLSGHCDAMPSSFKRLMSYKSIFINWENYSSDLIPRNQSLVSLNTVQSFISPKLKQKTPRSESTMTTATTT